ncbi:hypothetical protein LPJ61_006706, partial [Coemansia biformis]
AAGGVSHRAQRLHLCAQWYADQADTKELVAHQRQSADAGADVLQDDRDAGPGAAGGAVERARVLLSLRRALAGVEPGRQPAAAAGGRLRAAVRRGDVLLQRQHAARVSDQKHCSELGRAVSAEGRRRHAAQGGRAGRLVRNDLCHAQQHPALELWRRADGRLGLLKPVCIQLGQCHAVHADACRNPGPASRRRRLARRRQRRAHAALSRGPRAALVAQAAYGRGAAARGGRGAAAGSLGGRAAVPLAAGVRHSRGVRCHHDRSAPRVVHGPRHAAPHA